MNHSDLAPGRRNLALAMLLVLVLGLSARPPVTASFVAVQPNRAHSAALTYSSYGSILSFGPDKVVASNGLYALQVGFQGANAVVPTSTGGAAQAGRPAPLERVTYAGLWDGITLVYQPAGDGIYESMYSVAPYADPATIRLRYNLPVTVNRDGSLTIAFAGGQLQESAPVAWQVKAGVRRSVAISFISSSDREISFGIGSYDQSLELHIDPTLAWNSFLGSPGDDLGTGIALDGSGNIYVIGESEASWPVSPTPVRPFAGTKDVFVSKLRPGDSQPEWSTFLGSGGTDLSGGIAVSATGKVYVGGYSDGSWGTNIKRPFTSSPFDAFAAQLDASNGALNWNTFLGGSGNDWCRQIAIDASENVYLVGGSNASWAGGQQPKRPYALLDDIFVAQVDSAGILQWNTFLGGSDFDDPNGITLDRNRNIYVAGASGHTWGSDTPVHAPIGGWDGVVAKLSSSGGLLWYIFLGGSSTDNATSVAVDGGGNLLVTGGSLSPWDTVSFGNPVRAFSLGANNFNAYAALLDTNGNLNWYTFLGGTKTSHGNSIMSDGAGYAYVAGDSQDDWGCVSSQPPSAPCTVGVVPGGNDAYVAKLDSKGHLKWNTFLGGSSLVDLANGVAVDPNGNVYIAGTSEGSWGSPTDGFSGPNDAFVAKLNSDAHVITGNAGVGGAALTYTDGIGKTAKSLANGNYSITVSYDWSGTVVPFKPGFGFLPIRRAYSQVLSNLVKQNYVAYSPHGVIAPTSAAGLLPTYKWSKVAGATGYKFRLSTKSGTVLKALAVITPSCGTALCTYNPGVTLAYSTTYVWQVQAFVNGAWKSYAPFQFAVVLKPKPGFWSGQNGDLTFFVKPDRSHLVQFTATFRNVCGKTSFRATNPNSLPVTAHTFSFTGQFYGSGNFSTPTSVSGAAGYIFSSPSCNTGSLPWQATWVNSSQP